MGYFRCLRWQSIILGCVFPVTSGLLISCGDADGSGDTASFSTGAGDGDGELPAIPMVQRTTTEIERVDGLTRDFLGNSLDFDFYRNNTYKCGLTGNYTFLVVNPQNGDETTEAPLWVYLHGGGSGYFDENGDYLAVNNQDENTWNHEETMDDLIANPLELYTLENGQPKDTTLTRRILEGYRVALVGMCDHDQYLGLGTPYPNNPNAPKEVNGMQATMAAIDYIAANHPTTHVFAHGTSAGSVGAYALALSYSAEDIGLTGVVSDSVLSHRGKVIQEVLAGEPGFPQAAGVELESRDQPIVGLSRRFAACGADLEPVGSIVLARDGWG
ncbi:MAG: hypothetical protein GWP91_03295 [Rhodobacterales bacterium]|nr:hypothetical protein [Rhodobacterales bacterium]